MGVAPDYSKLSPDLQEKIKGWEANNPANKQLVKLNDIASILQDVSNVIDYRGKKSDETLKQLGAVLSDAREQLVAINAKEAPEAPDTSQPVIEAISKLEKALTSAVKAVDVKPVVNVPKIDAPVVNVAPTDVTVDTKEIAKILKTDIPQAFDKAIKSIVIPKNDNGSLTKALKELGTKLDDIDAGVRMKPQAPTSISINNTGANPIPITGSITASASTLADFSINDSDNTTTASTEYFGFTKPDGTWLVKKSTATTMRYATETNNGSVTTYSDAWAAIATLTYGRFEEAF